MLSDIYSCFVPHQSLFKLRNASNLFITFILWHCLCIVLALSWHCLCPQASTGQLFIAQSRAKLTRPQFKLTEDHNPSLTKQLIQTGEELQLFFFCLIQLNSLLLLSRVRTGLSPRFLSPTFVNVMQIKLNEKPFLFTP